MWPSFRWRATISASWCPLARSSACSTRITLAWCSTQRFLRKSNPLLSVRAERCARGWSTRPGARAKGMSSTRPSGCSDSRRRTPRHSPKSSKPRCERRAHRWSTSWRSSTRAAWARRAARPSISVPSTGTRASRSAPPSSRTRCARALATVASRACSRRPSERSTSTGAARSGLRNSSSSSWDGPTT